MKILKFQNKKSFKPNLQTKFIISFLIVIIIMVTTLGIVIYNKSYSISENQVISLGEQNSSQFCSLLDRQLYDLESTSKQLITNIDIFNALMELKNNSSDQDLAQITLNLNIAQTLPGILAFKYDRLKGIYYLFNNRVFTIYSSNQNNKISNNIFNEQWYTETLQKGGPINIIGTNTRYYLNGKKDIVISASRVVRNIVSHEKFGVLLIDYDYNTIASNISSSYINNVISGSETYVINSHNKIMSCINTKLLNTEINFDVSKYKQNSGVSIIKIDGRKMYMACQISPYTSWKVINLIPVDNLLKSLFSIKLYVILLIFICILIMLAFLYVISSILLNPVNRIIEAMFKVRSGDLSTRVSVNSSDEISFIAENFNSMIDHIEMLINKVYIAKIKQKEAQFQTLQSQINPHFLYNTLESIRGEAISCGAHEIALMSKCLAFLFKYSINKEILVSLKEEIDHLENYIAIQNFRFDNKFELKCNISKELQSCQILRLILQPLVENSIKHGFEHKIGNGIIEISAYELNETLRIQIYDNGTGMSPEKIIDINDKLLKDYNLNITEENNEVTTSGIGIVNVNSRIKLFFGKEYGLSFKESSIGNIQIIILPLERNEDKSI